MKNIVSYLIEKNKIEKGLKNYEWFSVMYLLTESKYLSSNEKAKYTEKIIQDSDFNTPECEDMFWKFFWNKEYGILQKMLNSTRNLIENPNETIKKKRIESSGRFLKHLKETNSILSHGESPEERVSRENRNKIYKIKKWEERLQEIIKIDNNPVFDYKKDICDCLEINQDLKKENINSSNLGYNLYIKDFSN